MADGSVTVYPNPSDCLVNFVITSPSVETIEIVDVIGKVIESKNFKSELTEFDLSDFSDGTYFYRLVDAGGKVILTDKVVIAE